MKKTNILFWVFNGLFAAFMLMSGLPDVFMQKEAVDFITTKLGYPPYFLPFIGVLKTLGAIAIVIPISPRIREWAYAGFFFDLLGATYSNIMVDGFQFSIVFMGVPFGFLALAYVYFHKKLNARESKLNLAAA